MASPGRPKALLELTESERSELERLLRRRKSGQALALRARIVLECASGVTNTEVSEKLGVTMNTVCKWRQRFVERRLDGLCDEPRPGTPRRISDDQVEEVVRLTLESMPQDASHWSRRSLAKRVGMTATTVGRIWKAFGLKPHRVETFKISADPFFVEKVRDIVGLYLSPPENAVVLCVDEKSQIQALDRSQPLLPMRPGQPERHAHDYTRHGTTSLFAALNVATGEVARSCYRRHRSVEFRRFLDVIDSTVPADVEVHLVLDNYTTHKTALIHQWLVKRPRFHLHFTPTSASWLNLVERVFGELTTRKLQRSAHTSVPQLERDIYDWFDRRDPKPYQWTRTADEILESLGRFCVRTSGAAH